MALIECRECNKEISKSAKVCPHCGAKPRRTSAFTWFVLILFVFFLIGTIANENNSGGGLRPPDLKAEVMQNIRLDFSWGKGGFDNIMLADFVIRNDSNSNIKDIEIKCVHSGKSGTVIDSNNKTIYDIISAHSTKKFNNENMGFIHSQAASSRCNIIDFSLM